MRPMRVTPPPQRRRDRRLTALRILRAAVYAPPPQPEPEPEPPPPEEE